MNRRAVLRIAMPEDLPSILGIYNEVVKNTTAIYQDSPRTLTEMEQWYAARIGYPTFVVEDEGKIVGYCGYGAFRGGSCYSVSAELSLHLTEAYRGFGIGKKMLDHIVAHARAQKSIHSLLAAIDSENVKSIAMHEGRGFKKVGLIPQVAHKFDRWLDLVLMQLILEISC